MNLEKNTFFRKIKICFPTPRYLNFNATGLDISTDAVRVMRLKFSKHGLVPDFYKEFKFKNPIDFSSPDFKIEENQEILNILKDLRLKYKIKNVVASLPETKTYLYKTTIKKEASSNIATAIRLSIEDNVPHNANDVNFDYEVVDDSDPTDLDIIVGVFPKDVIASYTVLLKKAGIFPLSFRPESVALSDSLVFKTDATTYLLVRLLPNKINVSVVEDTAVQYTSEILVGTDDLQEDLSGPNAAKIKEELNKILIYWFTNKKDFSDHKKIQTVLLAGGSASNTKIRSFLEKNLKINVDIGNVWSNCFSFEDYVPELNKEDALKYSVAIGLAIKALKHA